MLGRKLGLPVVNLGFSGNGRLEQPVTSLLSELEAGIFIVDCLPNMGGFPDDTIHARLIQTVRTLRRAHPETPVLITEHACSTIGALNTGRVKAFDRLNRIARAACAELKELGIRNIHCLPAEEIGLSIESTVDGVHPNDIGMEQYALAYERAIRSIIN